MTVVLDTNIVASATYWRGKPARSLEAWLHGRYELAVSHAILSEYEEVVARLGIRYPEKQSTDWLSAIRRSARMVYPSPLLPHTADPDDEMFIECAVAAKAECLITGDKEHLLRLKEIGGVSILSVSDFLACFQTQ